MREGGDATFICSTNPDAYNSYSWYVNEKKQNHVKNDNKLVIKSVKRVQNGANITCRVLWAGVVPNSAFLLMEVHCKYFLDYQ